jgi:CRISPR system CASCADE complex protein casE
LQGSPAYALFISSPVPPDPSHIVEAAGYKNDGGVVVRELDGFLDRLEAGQRWGFRLCVNPTFRDKGQLDRAGRKKILAHVTQEQQTKWVLDRAERCGFKILESADLGGELPVLEDSQGQRVDGKNLLINGVERSLVEFRRGNGLVRLSIATFEGVLEVSDPQALRHAVVSGIGRGKAYGCGLLTLARP